VLEKFFAENPYIEGDRKAFISKLTDLPVQQIKIWFQNRRQKLKRVSETEPNVFETSDKSKWEDGGSS